MNYVKQKGFTIVELLIVIVVIAILASISVVAYNGIRARSADAERQSDISSVGKKLAQYRILNSHYPRYDDMVHNNLVWIHANLPGLPDDALVAPGGTDTNSFNSSTSPPTNVYSYRVYFDDNDGTQRFCNQTNLNNYGKAVTDCDRYELRWRSEATNSVTMIRSRYGW